MKAIKDKLAKVCNSKRDCEECVRSRGINYLKTPCNIHREVFGTSLREYMKGDK